MGSKEFFGTRIWLAGLATEPRPLLNLADHADPSNKYQICISWDNMLLPVGAHSANSRNKALRVQHVFPVGLPELFHQHSFRRHAQRKCDQSDQTCYPVGQSQGLRQNAVVSKTIDAPARCTVSFRAFIILRRHWRSRVLPPGHSSEDRARAPLYPPTPEDVITPKYARLLSFGTRLGL